MILIAFTLVVGRNVRTRTNRYLYVRVVRRSLLKYLGEMCVLGGVRCASFQAVHSKVVDYLTIIIHCTNGG